MFYKLKNFLTEEELVEVRAEIKRSKFSQGEKTANGRAKEVKSNMQLTQKDAPDLIEKITQKISTDSKVKAFTVPYRFSPCMVNSYKKGEEYGFHMDNPMMSGVRTDLSYTIFLHPPESYEGGELMVEAETGLAEIKGDAGEMVIYPSGRLHRVNKVKKGERLAIVGWIQSLIKTSEERQVVIDLRLALSHINNLERNPDLEHAAKYINKSIHNFTRLRQG